MNTPIKATGLLSCFRLLVAASFFTVASMPVAHAQDAAALKAHHAALSERLASNAFQRPLVLESSESAGALKGDIYALIEQPYAVVGPALQGVAQWCDILILHLNVKQCRASSQAPGPTSGATAGRTANDRLILNIGRKSDQPPADAYRFDFAYTVVAARADYLHVALNAEQGPLGTRHYRVVLEVVALDARRSFVHLSYAYSYGVAAQVAMQGYLATAGRDKVGFSIVGTQANGQPEYIGGMRGVIERNTMRYYLAIESFLGALSAPLPQQIDQRLNAWHTSVERYPLQLHELERGEYLDMKRREIQRQREPSG